MPIDWHGEPSIVERFPNDIILVIAEDLAECCAYGSISALSMASHQLKRMLQPFLAQSKKKIWMRLEDWDWDEGDNTATDKYADIGIVECSADTPLPINHVRPTYTKKGATGSAREERFINLHCRPWMLLWQGHPHRSILTVCERFFPRIDILKVVVDTGVFRICDLENLAKIKSSPEISMAVNKIALTLMEKKVAAEWSWGDEIKVPRLRYMRHDNHRGMYPITYGRITSSVQAVGKAGFEYDRHEWSYYGEDEDLAEAEGYYRKHSDI
ncbi:hypothetical protein QFC19_004603 [Naganishia cerealis]|uniref:Uncharacterized protein n=1 Tax=Naganishia cerealis TaxID=610337 RepID=A0ACC2VUU9_9TREE|nr:hypothetical protein QFC19_004603 [Naganishia cerealis]